MAEPTTEKPEVVEQQRSTKTTEFQVGRIGHQAATGVGGAPPPLDAKAVQRIQRSALRADVLALQRAVGNRAVSALVRGETKEVAIQAKLEVGPVNDVYEREADHIARLVTSGIAQRKPVANAKSRDEEGDEAAPQAGHQSGPAFSIKRMVQCKRAESGVRTDGSFTANSSVHDRIRRMEGSGRPLPEGVRREMEPRFGADLGGVRIHTGGEAVQLSRDLGARAFTHGTHIAFGTGNFNPGSQAGRQLLAHELTHTIQQTGARPLPTVQRAPDGTVQHQVPLGTVQRGVWDSMKSFFSRKKPEPVVGNISGPIAGTPTQIQANALQKATDANQRAQQLIDTAKASIRSKIDSQNSVSPEMQGAKSTAKIGVAKDAIGSLQSGDKRYKKFLEQYQLDLTQIRNKIGMNRRQILMHGEKVLGNDSSSQAAAMQSHVLAEESAQLIEQLDQQAKQMDGKAAIEMAASRIGLKSGSASSMASAEKSASDSVLDLLQIKGKIQNYFLYLDTDFKVLQGHTEKKMASVGANYSQSAAFRAIGSGLARAKADGDPGVLDDDQAFGVGGISSMTEPEGQEESAPSETDQALKATLDMRAGQEMGQKTLKPPSTSVPKGPKPGETLNKKEKKFAQQVKKLEIRFMLYVKAQKRLAEAKGYHDHTERLYTETHAIYDKIDKARKVETHTQEMIDQATRDAGDAKAKVAQGAVYLEKMRKFKQEVYAESQKYKEFVGERAMAGWKRKAKKTVGLVAGPALRALTGGMYRIEAEDQAGGYQVALKGRTILDDIVRKHFELKQILRGVNGKPVKGLGGVHGARAYVFFKALSFALQIIRDIASAAALWVTIVTVGAGAPVGAVFASIALYAALSKAAIDLLLLIWSAVGLAKTNDPTSRMILRGENTRQGLAFGEGAFAGLSAGLVMGLSGNTGLLTGNTQTTAFGSGSRNHGAISDNWSQNIGGNELTYGSGLREGSNLAMGPLTPAVGNIGQNVGVNALSPYVPHTTMTSEQHNDEAEKVRRAKKAIRLVANPARTAFLDLAKFAEKKKKKSQSKFIAVLPDLAKTIESMGSTVEQVPESPPQPPQGVPQPA